MNSIVNSFTTLVAAGLLWLTLKGAYALTGSVPITLVLAALVAIQWAAARSALMALGGQTAAGSGKWRRVALWGCLWLAAASVTVSFVGAELYEMFAARNRAEARFEAEQSTLRGRARELQQALTAASTTAAQYARHAGDMAAREEQHGGSCMAGSRPGPGDIRAFRRLDAVAARGLAEQIEPEVAAASSTLNAVQGLRFDGDVPALRRALTRAVDDLNGLRAAPLWPQIAAFAEAQQSAAAAIATPGGTIRCDDAARQLMLSQLQRTAKSVLALQAMAPPQLLNHADSREIAQATLVRTWAAVLGLLPRSLWGRSPLVDDAFRTRYGLVEAPAVLSANSLPLMLAWMLELILISLLMLSASGRTEAQPPGSTARLRHWAGERLRQRPGLVGELAQALTGPPAAACGGRAPYVDRERLFADEAMEERAWTVAPWYRPWGALDIIAVPMTRYAAVRAARELWRAGLLSPLAWDIDTAQLLRDRRLSSVMHAIGESVPDSVWEVYKVGDEHLARWLLSQPIEARAVLPRATSPAID